MSIDFGIYGRDLDHFDAGDFCGWARQRGYDVELHPEFSLTGGGFQPMRIDSFLTGMEVDMDEYVPEPVYVRQTILERLLRKKPEMTAFSEKAQNANRVIWLSCSGIEPLETAAAHLLGAYFCDVFGAQFDDPQLGCVDTVAKVILITADELLEEAKKTVCQPFTGWDDA